MDRAPKIQIQSSTQRGTFSVANMKNEDQEKQRAEFVDFFVSLGYAVERDRNTRTGESWFEIIDRGEKVIQIDDHVPINIVIADLISLHNNGGVVLTEYDYKITGPESEAFVTLKRRVATLKRIFSK